MGDRAPRIYMAGPNGEWHDEVRRAADDADVEWVNPFELHDFDDREEAYANAGAVHDRDMAAVEDADALYLHLHDEYAVGAAMEAQHAVEKGIPVVVRDARETDGPAPLMLLGSPMDVEADREAAVAAAIDRAREAMETETALVDRLVGLADGVVGDGGLGLD